METSEVLSDEAETPAAHASDVAPRMMSIDETNKLLEELSSHAYNSPPSGITNVPDGLECLVSMEDITKDNYVEYLCYPSLQWKASKISQPIIEHLLETQFNDYISRVQKSDCQAELRRLLTQGPPIYISDPYGLPLTDGDAKSETTTTDKNRDVDTTATVTDSDTNVATETSSGDSHVVLLWYFSDQQIHSAKLQNAIDKNDERYTSLWNELKAYLIE